MEDIVGDYADKTVTLEDFPFYDTGLKMASIHPCKHASVMKSLLERADAALKLRMEKVRAGGRGGKAGAVGVAGEGGKGEGGGSGGQGKVGVERGMEGLVEEMGQARIAEEAGRREGSKAAGGGDEWEMLQQTEESEEEAIRVDQYLVVFLKVGFPFAARFS